MRVLISPRVACRAYLMGTVCKCVESQTSTGFTTRYLSLCLCMHVLCVCVHVLCVSVCLCVCECVCVPVCVTNQILWNVSNVLLLLTSIPLSTIPGPDRDALAKGTCPRANPCTTDMSGIWRRATQSKVRRSVQCPSLSITSPLPIPNSQ